MGASFAMYSIQKNWLVDRLHRLGRDLRGDVGQAERRALRVGHDRDAADCSTERGWSSTLPPAAPT